ncbi:MAG: SpoIIE family protein phosphatase [Bacteroidales bacterium]|nr:SpoIIE family protein phosphatase [Bacteroidales bacterium]
MKRIFIYIVFSLISIIGLAQKVNEMHFEQVSMEDGLSQVGINSIIQDSTGFLWFATLDGLNRYDGYDFKIFKPSASDTTSISSNRILCLYLDSEGKIWVGTLGGGLNVYNPITETFTRYMHNPKDENSLSNNDVYDIVEDNEGLLWIATYGGGLNCFDRKANKFTAYKHNPSNLNSIGSNQVRVVNKDHLGNIWVGVNEGGGLDKFDKRTGIFQHINFIAHDIMSIENDKFGNLWIGTYYGGFGVLNPETHEYKVYENSATDSLTLSNNIVWTFYEDTISNIMYVGTRGGGLNMFDLTTRQFLGSEKMNQHENSLSSNNILSILRDKSGILWIGSETAGLNKYNTHRKKFATNHPSADFKKAPLSSDNVMSILEIRNFSPEHDGHFLVGTRGAGLLYYDKNFNVIKSYQSKKDDKESFNMITSIVQDPRGFFWLGTDGNGLFRFSLERGILDHYIYEENVRNVLPNSAVTAMCLDNKLRLWIGTYGGGLCKFEWENCKFTTYDVNKSNFMRNAIWCVMQDSQDMIWAGTNGRGVMSVNPETDEVNFYEPDRSNPKSLNSEIVYSLLESGNGTFWVGTGGAGISKFNRREKTFESYTQKSHGLTNDMVLAIQEDRRGNLWISTCYGISKFAPFAETFTNYNQSDGLQGNSFNERASFKSANGYLFFGGSQGLSYFYPDSIINDTYTGRVVITDLKIFNKIVEIGEEIQGDVVLKQSITTTKELELSYKYNFSIDFSILNNVAPSKVQYKYRLVGFDEDWNYTDASKRSATYTNLAGGEYVFEVTATNNDGVWSDEITQIKITIIPPFWKTTWFYSLLFLLLGLGIYVYIKYREHFYKEENTKLERMVKERTNEIEQQKSKLELQSDMLARNNEELSKSNRLIKASISYAKRIQDAILPSISVLHDYIPSAFILFKPRDVVSGDFYWFLEKENKMYVAVVDCTGHGVPGAFMSMIGATLLQQITYKKLRTPAEILDKLNLGVRSALNQKENATADSQEDGMDITLCLIDKENRTVQIAAANHVAYCVHDDLIETIDGDMASVGGSITSETTGGFTNHEFTYTQGTRLYMFSDGFQDQFGGENNKKFLGVHFKKLLFESSNLPMEQQCELLDKTFEDWKGSRKQIDDVLVLGLELD